MTDPTRFIGLDAEEKMTQGVINRDRPEDGVLALNRFAGCGYVENQSLHQIFTEKTAKNRSTPLFKLVDEY